MITTTHRFQQVWGYAKADVACRVCGAISKRNIKEYCTINPFNKNDDGTPKTHAQVSEQAREAAKREAARQVAEGRVCRTCEVPRDVARLVIAARRVAFGDPSPEDFRELDRASEAFAARVAWENQNDAPATSNQSAVEIRGVGNV